MLYVICYIVIVGYYSIIYKSLIGKDVRVLWVGVGFMFRFVSFRRLCLVITEFSIFCSLKRIYIVYRFSCANDVLSQSQTLLLISTNFCL